MRTFLTVAGTVALTLAVLAALNRTDQGRKILGS